jgi:uncharacterized repeat protein (TIGR01451 family)
MILVMPALSFAWPTDSQWIPLTKGGLVLQDSESDAQGSRNIVPNDGSSPASYIFNDGTYLNYRIRLDADPTGIGGQGLLGPFGWGFEIDIDQNADDYEWLVMCDGISQNEVITLGENTSLSGVGDPGDHADNIVASYPLAGNHRVVLAPTTTGGDPDYFLDFRLPYDVFMAQTGITENTLIRYFIGTSQQAAWLTADLLGGSDLYTMASDYTTPTGGLPPVSFTDGEVAFVDKMEGFNIIGASLPGSPLYVRVLDLDQTVDLNPDQVIRVTLVSSGTTDTETLILYATGIAGKFTGQIPTAVGGASDQDGTLQITATDTVTVSYVEAIAANLAQNVERTAMITISSTATDVELSKTVDKNNPDPGEAITYTITILNTGPNIATNIQISDPNPAGVTFGAPVPSVGSYAGGIWTIPSLAVDISATLTIPATVDLGTSGQTITNTANVDSLDQTDPHLSNNAASASIYVTGTDLFIDKHLWETPPPDQNDNIMFHIHLTNLGPNSSDNIVVTDLLPAGLLFVSATPGQGTYDEVTGVWDVGTLASGSSVLLEIICTVTAVAGTTITNTAAITASSQPDFNPANNSDTIEIEVGALDLVLSKTVDDPGPIENGTIKYTINVTNNGPVDATNLAVTDNLPTGVTYVSDDGGVSYSGGVWTIGALASGSTASLEITATVDSGTSGQTINNIASITAVDQSDTDINNNIVETAIIVGGVDLILTKTVDNEVPNPGDTIVYTLTLFHNRMTDATNVVVNDLEPAGVTFLSYIASGTTSFAMSGGNPSYDWDVGTLTAGSTETLQITATVDSGTTGQTIKNLAFITAIDQEDVNTSDNIADVDIAVSGTDLALTKVVNNPTPNIDDYVVFTLTLTNNGSATATNIEVTDLLPPELLYDSDNGGGTYDQVTGIWTIASLAVGGSAALDITAQVQSDGSSLEITNTAYVSAVDQGDQIPGNNSDSATLYLASTDLVVAKSVDDATPGETSTITYTITVNNSGTYDSNSIILGDVLPTGVTFVSYAASQGVYLAHLWYTGSLPAGATATLTIDATVNPFTAGSTITNTATLLSYDIVDSDLTNNSDSVDIVPSSLPVLTILKSADKVTVNPGEVITYTITVLNSGSGIATNVDLDDQLSPYTQWGLNLSGSDPPFDWNPGTSGLEVVLDPLYLGYSKDGGTVWGQTATDGGGGAPAGYDGTITNWKYTFNNDMAAGGTFSISYKVMVR